jgi:hypothetical protein
MDFEEAGRRYVDLRARYGAGQLDQRQFADAVGRLRVQDAAGRWWTLDPDGGWLWWNGAAWVAAAGTQSGGAAVATRVAARPARRDAPAGSVFGKTQRYWNLVSMLGGLVAGGGYYYYSSLRADREGGVDWLSAALIVLMPLLLTVFRGPLDALLRPLNAIKRRIPRLVLIGAGLVTPYLCAYYLYNNTALLRALPPQIVGPLYGGSGLIQYEYMRTTLVVGTLLSYVILRMPARRRGGAR